MKAPALKRPAPTPPAPTPLVSSRPVLSAAPIARETLQEGVYRRITDLILVGEIAPGQVVTMQSLAEAFGVSTMPVREALKRLTAAGALSLVSGRSIGIPVLTRARLADLRRVRVSIEGMAAEWAAGRIEDAAVTRLREQYRALGHAVKNEDAKAYLRANKLFHFIIYEAAASPALVALIETLWLQTGPYLNLLRGSGNYENSNAAHKEVVEALAARDGPRAARAMRTDIDEAWAIMETMLG